MKSRVGGNDVFGVEFDKAFYRYNYSFQTYDNSGTRQIYTTNPYAQDEVGIVFSKQDYEFNWGNRYTWDWGYISLDIAPHEVGYASIWSLFGHSCNGCEVRSLTITNNGIGLIFSNEDRSFQCCSGTNVYKFNWSPN